MLVEVRMFGGLTERLGESRITMELPDDATVADLRSAVATAYPTIAPLLARVSVAVDLEVARDDTPLAGASEFALLPPVAGGAADPDGSRVRVVTGLQSPPFEVDAVVAEVAGPSVGGTAVFLGTVRDHAPDLNGVVGLEYSAYPEMAERVLAQLAEELQREHPSLSGIALLHAVGDLEVGDHTVLIVCASAHRAEAFDACRDALERVKDRVPVWKREVTADGGHRWVGLGARPQEEPVPGVRALPATEAASLLDDPRVVVLDIRTDAEFAQARLPRAIQLDYDVPGFAQRVAELDRDACYLMYCRSGQRSGDARILMDQLGFRDVVDVRGGLIAWMNAGLPVDG